MVEPEQVTDYIAVSNTVMGVLLVAGAVNAALALLGTEIALTFIALLGIVGFFLAHSMPKVRGPL